jgi:hypothetical protein
MRLKVDENLPIETAQLLRAAGHDALTVMISSSSATPTATRSVR